MDEQKDGTSGEMDKPDEVGSYSKGKEEWHLLNSLDYGMSRRDYFAGQALIGLLTYDPTTTDAAYEPNFVAKTAYKYADAMIKEGRKDGQVEA